MDDRAREIAESAGLRFSRDIETLSDAISAYGDEREREALEWQPIETAPKDGRTLLLGYYNALGKWRTVRGQWFSDEEISDWENDCFEAWWYETSVENDDLPNCWMTNPTHWMPLPAPPEPSRPAESGFTQCPICGTEVSHDDMGHADTYRCMNSRCRWSAVYSRPAESQAHPKTCAKWIQCGDHEHYEDVVPCSCGQDESQSGERVCVLCGHDCVDDDGICDQVIDTENMTPMQMVDLRQEFWDDNEILHCGCKCEFAASEKE